jgi:hypothetical protein
MLLKKVDLLESQARQYKLMIHNYEETDSLNQKFVEAQESYYISRLSSLNESLNKEKKKKTLYKAGLFGTIGAAILALIVIK